MKSVGDTIDEIVNDLVTPEITAQFNLWLERMTPLVEAAKAREAFFNPEECPACGRSCNCS